MSPLDQIAADVAARITQADSDCADANAAFVAGRFNDYMKLKAAEVMKRLEAAGDHAIANATGS